MIDVGQSGRPREDLASDQEEVLADTSRKCHYIKINQWAGKTGISHGKEVRCAYALWLGWNISLIVPPPFAMPTPDLKLAIGR